MEAFLNEAFLNDNVSPAGGVDVLKRVCRGTSLIRNCLLLGSYSRPMPRTLQWSSGGRWFLTSEVQGLLAHKATQYKDTHRRMRCGH